MTDSHRRPRAPPAAGWRTLREVERRNAWFLLKALRRSQRLMRPRHYLRAHRLGVPGIEPRVRGSRFDQRTVNVPGATG